MPELPEVETIKLQLASVLPRHTIKSVEIRFSKIFSGDIKNLKSKTITGVRRLGKMLVIDMTGEQSMAIHLKMTGRLVYENVKSQNSMTNKTLDLDYQKDKHTHVVITFTSGDKLYYNDQRKFGWLKLIRTGDINSLSYIKNLGPEFLSNLTFPQFLKILNSSGRPVKLVVTDQGKIAGSGNIYANEALWCAKINPLAPADDLSEVRVRTLFNCFEKILRQAIIWQGASSRNYRNAYGEKGQVQKHFEVYERKGEKCRRCGSTIKKIKLGGRGTYFCPNCQKH